MNNSKGLTGSTKAPSEKIKKRANLNYQNKDSPMGRRILVLLLSTIVVALPQAVSALGLGEITLKSALNQPLEADIQLLEVRDLTEVEILVGLASADDFERVGVDRPYFLTNLRFAVVLDAPGGPVIRLTSNKPVREPFVNFVLQAQWPSGKLLREYTLLMDLPVFSAQKAQPVTAAQTQPSRPTQQQVASQPPVATPKKSQGYNPRSSFDEAPVRPTVTQQARPQTSYQAPVQRPSQPRYDEDAYGPVQANETLWKIAQQVRPDRSVSIQQTMLAIQRLNPEAFINNNINLLRKGQILRVPDRTQIIEYNKREAIQEVAVQNNQWSGDPNGGFGPTSRAQLEGSRSIASSNDTVSAVEGRVKLTSPEDVTGSEAGRGAGAGASSLDALENELAITLEQLDKSERENSDLKSHVEALEEQISTQERMLEIRSEELRAMELAAEKNREQRERALAEADIEPVDDTTGGEEFDGALGIDDSVVGDGIAMSDQEIIDGALVAGDIDDEGLGEAAIVESTPEPTVVPTAEPTVDTKKVISAPTPAKKSIIEHLLDNLVFIAGGLAALILAAYFFLRYRNASEEFETEDDFLAQPYEDFKSEEPLVEPPEEELALDVDVVPEEEEQEQEQEYYQEEPEVDEAAPIGGAQTEDVVAEADIYIAYGKYDQAEEMLLTALENEPENAGVRVKLLEVYATQQDVERFDPQFARLLVTEDAIAKQRGHQLREGIAGAQPFDESLYDVSRDATSYRDADEGLDSDVNDDFDELSLDLDDGDDLSLESSDDSESLDFELDLDEQTIETRESEEEDPLDFELDLDTEAFDTELESADSSAADLDLELGLPADEPDASLGLKLDIEEAVEGEDIDVEDFDLDFDLDAEEDITADDMDKTGVFDTSDLDSLTIEEEKASESDTEEFDLSDLESLPGEEEELTFESTSDQSEGHLSLEPESVNDSEFDLEAELESLGGAQEALGDDLADESDASNDNLDLDDSLDLSALDKELDALTSGLSVEGADIDNLESVLDEHVPSKHEDDLDLEDGLETPTVMVEPVTDFDDFEEELQADLNEEELDEIEIDTPEAATQSGEDRLFDQAVAGVPESDLEFDIPSIDPEADDDDLGFLSDSDETATKLDLARAYIDMGDAEGAKDILGEIIKEGNTQQKQEAESLLARV